MSDNAVRNALCHEVFRVLISIRLGTVHQKLYYCKINKFVYSANTHGIVKEIDYLQSLISNRTESCTTYVFSVRDKPEAIMCEMALRECPIYYHTINLICDDEIICRYSIDDEIAWATGFNNNKAVSLSDPDAIKDIASFMNHHLDHHIGKIKRTKKARWTNNARR